LLMREHIGETFEGTVSALVGSGAFISLDSPFVDVLVRYEAMGPDQYQLSEDELSVVGARSGDTVALGDRVLVTVEDVAILRRQTRRRQARRSSFSTQRRDWPRQAEQATRSAQVKRPPQRGLPARDPIGAHESAQRLGQQHAAVSLLILLQDREPGTADRETG